MHVNAFRFCIADSIADPDPHLFLKAGSGSALKTKFKCFRGFKDVDAHNEGLEAQNGALEVS